MKVVLPLALTVFLQAAQIQATDPSCKCNYGCNFGVEALSLQLTTTEYFSLLYGDRLW